MSKTIATLKNLKKSYSGRVIFQDINMEINRYEPVVVMGDNGCGKSTLLRIVAGLIAYDGEITYRPNIKIAYAPDHFPRLPFTAESYLMHMGKIQGLSASKVNAFIDKYFSFLKMPQAFRKTKIAKCSKGTIQKINILQTLLTTPDLLILDEPFSGLDENSEA
ncbi:MAG: ATP-binding cassette domain-containing protein, partial [Defluviitaleaceae bacterium]|nr:ATP-binding cassette domain-containing protein [Defluviitaleaceae bacterium]